MKFRLYSKIKEKDMLYRSAFGAIAFFLVAMAGIAVWLGAAATASADVPRITVEQAKELLGNPDVIIIDVRTPKTWWRSPTKILNAVRENPEAVEKWAGKYPKDKTLILYCS